MSKEKNKPQQSATLWTDLKENLEELLQWGSPKEHSKTLELIFEAFMAGDEANDLKTRNQVMMFRRQMRSILKTLDRNQVKVYHVPDLPLAQTS